MTKLVVKKNTETIIDNFIEKNAKKYGIPKVTLKALQDFGIFDARVLSVLTENEIAAIPNISEKTAVSLVRAADDNFRGPLFQKAADQSERLLKKRKYFTTGSTNLDKLLGGGMPTSAIIEINGEYRTGKTQTCLTCSITAQLPEEKGGLGRPVIYFDTENSFQAEHLQDIAERFGLDREEVLSNLFVVQAEQLRYLNQAIDRLPGYVQALDPGLIIIDSLMAPFRAEFHELNLLAVRQKKIGKLIGLLKRIAIAFNTSVIFTNQVMANIGTMGAQYNPVIAAGGHVLAHASDIRINMKKLKENMRRAKIEDCAWLPTDTTDFFITPNGIADDSEVKTKINGEEDIVGKDESEIDVVEEPTPMMAGIQEVTKSQSKQKFSDEEEFSNIEMKLDETADDFSEEEIEVENEFEILQIEDQEQLDEIAEEIPKEKPTKVKEKSTAKKSKVPA